MTNRSNDTAWIIFYDGIQELARLSADHATAEEIEEARGLLAYEYGLHPDEIGVRHTAAAGGR